MAYTSWCESASASGKCIGQTVVSQKNCLCVVEQQVSSLKKRGRKKNDRTRKSAENGIHFTTFLCVQARNQITKKYQTNKELGTSHRHHFHIKNHKFMDKLHCKILRKRFFTMLLLWSVWWLQSATLPL